MKFCVALLIVAVTMTAVISSPVRKDQNVASTTVASVTVAPFNIITVPDFPVILTATTIVSTICDDNSIMNLSFLSLIYAPFRRRNTCPEGYRTDSSGTCRILVYASVM
ncbi:hypothetical protein PUN28_015124 [Cardiocondyla obscurior]|uniref:Uncharacterized protein n=1 Tax=Cardiocondyla obscurior TaxID=286306 RepID=A0AAW2F0I9_9HYME